MNKIFILEGKQGEVLAILSNKEDITYSDFNNMCQEIAETCDNDFYVVKDKLVNEMDFSVVDVAGGFICNKRKGAF